MPRKASDVRLRLLLADQGTFHHEEIAVPAAALERHARLVDALLEDEDVLRRFHVDPSRLCSAQVVQGD
jgi:hypothetical protein